MLISGFFLRLPTRAAILVALSVCILAACSQSEVKRLKDENESLKKTLASLQKEISEIKESPEYCYQQGVGYSSEGNYGEALTQFQYFVDKYPTHELVASAKEQIESAKKALDAVEAESHYKVGLENMRSGQFEDGITEFKLVISKYPKTEFAGLARDEIKKAESELAKLAVEEEERKEREKYRPKTIDEAISEWDMFRSDPDKYKGQVTTWRLFVRYYSKGGYITYIGGLDGSGAYLYDLGYKVWYSDIPYDSPQASVSLKTKEDDWVIITGKFNGVSRDGVVMLTTTNIIHEGYRANSETR